MKARTAAAAVLLSVTALAGCGDDDPAAGPSDEPSPSSAATTPGTTGSTSSPTGTGTPAPPAPTAAVPFPANTDPDTADASGGILGMKVARAAAQQGFDRVVFELQGKGAPGWNVSYTPTPTSDGSGDPVQVKGSAFLQVIITATGYPGDTGVPEPAKRRFTPATPLVKEVVLDGVFEGQYTAFIGLGRKKPFRVFRLSSPPRVVVDIRTS